MQRTHGFGVSPAACSMSHGSTTPGAELVAQVEREVREAEPVGDAARAAHRRRRAARALAVVLGIGPQLERDRDDVVARRLRRPARGAREQRGDRAVDARRTSRRACGPRAPAAARARAPPRRARGAARRRRGRRRAACRRSGRRARRRSAASRCARRRAARRPRRARRPRSPPRSSRRSPTPRSRPRGRGRPRRRPTPARGRRTRRRPRRRRRRPRPRGRGRAGGSRWSSKRSSGIASSLDRAPRRSDAESVPQRGAGLTTRVSGGSAFASHVAWHALRTRQSRRLS